jgi:hypothetical protein
MLHGDQGTQVQYCAVRHDQRIEISRHAGGSQSTSAAPGLLEDVEGSLRVRFGRKQTAMQRRGVLGC